MLIDSEHRIITTDGYQTDENNALDELIIPSHVKTLAVPSKVTFEGTTLNWIPSTSAALQEFEATNMTTINNSTAKVNGYSSLTSVSFPDLLTFTHDSNSTVTAKKISAGMFYNCSSLTEINMPKLQSFYSYIHTGAGAYYGVFDSCGITSITLPSLESYAEYRSSSDGGMYSTARGAFANCTNLTTVILPKIKTIRVSDYSRSRTFSGCVALTNVILGSLDNPVDAIPASFFAGLTQSTLTITVYTNGGASLANEPWGATNASIVYEEA